jgi:hypothetical protein
MLNEGEWIKSMMLRSNMRMMRLTSIEWVKEVDPGDK